MLDYSITEQKVKGRHENTDNEPEVPEFDSDNV